MNALKEKLLAGKPAIGVSVMLPFPQVVEMVGHLGFDWVLIDCEHGAISPDLVETLAMAAAAAGIVPIARPPTSSPVAITQMLDRGVASVQIPHVGHAAEARRVVEAVKYAPLGSRGLAVGTRAARYGVRGSLARHVVEANRDTLVCVQLEDTDALRDLEAIAAVEGVDVVFVGPSDLSQSLGYPGDITHPVVQDTMRMACTRITAAGKVAGTTGTTGTADMLRTAIGAGAGYVYVHVTTLLARASEEILGALQPPA
ncbi:MAG: HpcH/HpaI aldolase family protein [Nitrososphaerota archaeon]